MVLSRYPPFMRLPRGPDFEDRAPPPKVPTHGSPKSPAITECGASAPRYGRSVSADRRLVVGGRTAFAASGVGRRDGDRRRVPRVRRSSDVSGLALVVDGGYTVV